MLLKIHPDNPNARNIKTAVECLKNGSVIIYPTDTVYGIGCDIHNQKAVERVCRIKGIKPENANFSLIFHDLSQLSEFTTPLNNTVYKLLRKALPGPFTFILNGNNNVPKIFRNKKKTIGIRIPANAITLTIAYELGSPIMNTSVHDDDEVLEYITDPELIHEKYERLVDIVIDGGYGGNVASTIIDCTNDQPEVIREGLGDIEKYI